MSWLDEYDTLKNLCEAMKDPELERALEVVVECMKQPDQNPKAATEMIVELQALSAKFAASSVWYKTFGLNGKEERYKKDTYYTMRASIDALVDALKYAARLGRPTF